MRSRVIVALMGLTALLLPATGRAAGDVTPGWVTGPSMSQPRFDHFAVTLKDGRVLVGGGNAGSSVTAGVQIYDPRYDSWRPAASMFVARQRATATLLADGRVFVMGGLSTTSPTSAQTWGEIYDPVEDEWRGTDKAGSSKVGHAAVPLSSGSVLVVGGDAPDGAPTKTAQLYDPATDRWQSVPDMGLARTGATATVLKDGRVLVLGGTGTPNTGLSSAEIFNPSTQQWKPVKPMSRSRWSGHTATLLADGRVLVAGGYDVPTAATAGAEVYDPAADTWTSVSGMRHPRAHHTATRLANGDVLIMGGELPGGTWTEADRYAPATNTFSEFSFVSQGTRSRARAALMGDGRVLVTGGTGSFSADLTTLRYTAATTFLVGATIWDLGAEPVGAVGPLRGFTVTNTGDQPLIFSSLATTGVSAREFRIGGEGCAVAVVAPGESCQLAIGFLPTAAGQRRATLTFRVNAFGPAPSVDLKGVGTVAVTPTATPTPTATAIVSATPTATVQPLPTPPPTPNAGPVATGKPSGHARIVFRNGYRVAAKQRASHCRGRVSLELRRGKRSLAKRVTKLDRKCRFGATFKVAWSRIGRARTLTVVVRFHGNRHFGATTNRFKVKVPG
jgi:N-acetylneuraminic acid mutarotase